MQDERVEIVGVETHHETTHDMKAARLDAADGFPHVHEHVRPLVGFDQALHLGGLDSDVNHPEVCLLEQVEQFLILGNVQGQLCQKSHGLLERFVVFDEADQQFPGEAFVADKIVIHEKNGVRGDPLQSPQFFYNMIDGRIVSNVLVGETVTLCEFLVKSRLFTNLPASTLTEIAQKMQLESFGEGKFVIQQGDAGDKFYLIRKGSSEVIVKTGDTSRTVAALGEGDFFGEAALITGEPRNASVITKEETLLYSLEKNHFTAAMDASQSFKEQLLNAFYQRQ